MGCGCELYGQQIVNPNSTNPVYTLPSRRLSETETYVVEVLELNSATNLNITVSTKKLGGTWTAAGSFAAITVAGVYSLRVTGQKEWTRVEYALGPTPAAGESYRVVLKRQAGPV